MEYDGYAPVRHCACGATIGDGDYATGKRKCARCRSTRRRRR